MNIPLYKEHGTILATAAAAPFGVQTEMSINSPAQKCSQMDFHLGLSMAKKKEKSFSILRFRVENVFLRSSFASS
jgi:hypothetical protein